jgi:hypothetical protein
MLGKISMIEIMIMGIDSLAMPDISSTSNSLFRKNGAHDAAPDDP